MSLRDNDIVDGTAVPTIGFWRKGDIVINTSPSASTPTLWVCTVSGEPGTWTALGGGPVTPTTVTASGDVSVGALFKLAGIEDGLTAAAGGTQAAALALSATKSVHRVSTVATAADSVKLPAATAGQVHFVMNSAAANSMQVFGSGTDTINDVATATGVAQAAGKGALYVCVSAGKWYRALGA